MNPTLFFASVAAALFASAQAGYIYIWSPYAATQCGAGRPCPIAWNVAQDGPQFSKVDIEVLAGDANNAQVIAPVVLGYDLSNGNNYVWNVPENFKEHPDAFIRIKGVGTDYDSYSHRFPIAAVGNTIIPTIQPTATATASESSTVVPTESVTRSASRTASATSVRPSKTATSSSSAASVQGSLSAVAAVVAAAFAVMMF